MGTTFLRVRRTAQPVYVGTFVLIRFAHLICFPSRSEMATIWDNVFTGVVHACQFRKNLAFNRKRVTR